MPNARSVCVLVATLAPFTLQGQAGSAQPSLPPPTDIDAQFTEQLGQAEQQFCKAILNKEARTLDSLVSPNFALRVADVPKAACRVPFGWTAPCTASRANIASNITSSRANSATISRLSAWSGVRRDVRWTRLQRRLLFGRFLAEEQRELADYRPVLTPLGKFPERPPRQCRPWRRRP